MTRQHISSVIMAGYMKELKSRRPNLPVILVLLYSVPISMAVTIGQKIIFNILLMSESPRRSFGASCYVQHVEGLTIRYVYISRLVECLLLSIAYPISGWVADIKLGRGKSINLSLWLAWVGMLTICCSDLFQYIGCDMVYDILRYSGYILGLIFLMLGTASFHTNALAYMADQMPDASSSQIQSFIRWFTWTLLVGFGCDYLEVLDQSLSSRYIIIGTFFFAFVIMTISLVIHQFTTNVFMTTKPVRNNPYSLVYRVLQFARKNKNKALNRSSLTYWEDKMPSRIDLGKSRYGGPFTEEEVENVKSFGKVVTIFVFLGGIFIPYFDLANQGAVYGHQYKYSQVLHGYGSYLVWQTFVMLGVILIPLCELVIIPLFPKLNYFFNSPLKGLFIAHVLALAAIVALLGIQAYILANHNSFCYLSVLVNSHEQVHNNVHFIFLIIPCSIIGLYVMFSFSESLQVICSQAPHEMSGMLMGVFWFIRAIYISMGTLISIVISNYPNLKTCSFWVLLVLLIFAAIGIIAFTVFMYYYPFRERATVYHNQQVIEEHYDKYLDSANLYQTYQETMINTGSDDLQKIVGWSDNVVPVQ